MTILLVVLLLFLLFGGSRIAAAGKGLGEGVRDFKRALGIKPSQNSDALSPEEPVRKPHEPKLLPAKGESSASQADRDSE